MCDPLATDPVELLAAAAYRLWDSVVTSHGGNKALYATLRDPRPGDMVLEVTNFRTTAHDRLGRLILTRNERFPFSDLEEAEHYYEDRVWYIERLNGSVIWWRNCRFIRVVERPFDASPDQLAEDERRRIEFVTTALIWHRLHRPLAEIVSDPAPPRLLTGDVKMVPRQPATGRRVLDL